MEDVYTFRVGPKDRVGCTIIDKDTFKHVLELTHADPIRVKRVSGPEYEVSAIRCTSSGRTHYQVDFSEIDLHIGSTVTLTPSDDELNTIHMAIVEPADMMWERRGVVDAIADLQRRMDDLEAAIWN